MAAFAGAAGNRDTISEIRVEGATRISRETILEQIQFKTGDRYDAAKSEKALHALYASGLYKDVRIDRKGTVVVIAVVENPIVAAVAFSGNKDVKSEVLTPLVKLKAGTPYTDARAHTDALSLRAHYRREGRMSTEVTPEATPKPDGKVDVTFEIGEGKVNRVSSIDFEGNSAFKSAELEAVIRTARSSWLDIIKSDSVYAADRLELDSELLRRHYMMHGYPEVKITKAEGALDAAGSGYAVKFAIDEGDRFDFGAVTLDSAIVGVDVAALKALIGAREGEPYNAEAIDKSTEAISLALWEAGRQFARAVPKFAPDRKRHLWPVAYRVEDGPHIIIERLEITGNTRTNDEVIRRELHLKEGGAFNPLMLAHDRARVKGLGFFKSVAMETKPGSAKDKVVVSIAVEEDNTQELSFGAGYSSAQGIIGDIALEDKNLFGTGRSAKIKIAGSMVKLQAEIGFTDPHLLGSNVVGGFDIFYRDYDVTEQSSYKSQKIGGDLRAAYALSDTVTGSLNYTFSQNKIFDVGANASAAIKEAVPGFPAATSNTYYTSSIGYALAYDTRNARKLPTSGSYFQLAQDFAGVGGDVRYVKSTLDARQYYTVADNVTFVARAAAGNISGWGGQDVRLLDMFNMGGETVRGFAPAGIGPRDTLSTNRDALGGTNYFSTTAEMRFGLPLVPDGIGLRGAIFADAGSLFGTSANVSRLPGIAGTASSLRASVGAGLIWDSPVGPLRADYAFPLAKQAFDKTRSWGFGIATY